MSKSKVPVNQSERVDKYKGKLSTSMFGLAVVIHSIDPSWPKWACVYPGDKATQWFDSSVKAHNAAERYNNRKR